MIRLFFLFAILVVSTFAQTCSDAGNGPCLNGACPTTGDVCITSTDACCSAANVIYPTTTCMDKCGPNGVSDCPNRAYLCNNSLYYDLMTDQCPRTCGRCTTTSSATTCVDKVGSNGVSDCPSRAYLCSNSVYYTLMTDQCPRTCGRC